MSTIVMTGATGFLGRHVAARLSNDGHRVIALVREGSASVVPSGVAAVSVDYASLDFHVGELMGELKGESPLFLHFAWAGVNRDGVCDESIQTANVEMSLACLHLAECLGSAAFLFCGSRAEYGSLGGRAFSEGVPYNPDSQYGIAKLRFFEEMTARCHLSGMPFLEIRPFSVIGPDDHSWSIVMSSCRELSQGHPMEYGPCTQSWNFMGVDDFSRAVEMLLPVIEDLPMSDDHVVNVASYDTRVLRSFVEEIAVLTGRRGPMSFGSLEGAPGPFDVVPSISKLVDLTGWEQSQTFGQVVSDILEVNSWV